MSKYQILKNMEHYLTSQVTKVMQVKRYPHLGGVPISVDS